MHADARPGGEFGAHPAVAQGHRIIAGPGDLAVVVKPRAIAGTGLSGITRIKRHVGPGLWHDQNIAKVRMARARKMGVAEPLNGRIFIAIPGGMPIAGPDLARRIGIG